MRKVKHNKIRNTGLLFEFLLRQITSDVLNKDNGPAVKIVKEKFNEHTELGKELALYNILITKTYRFHDFPPFWAGTFSEPKIGSEMGCQKWGQRCSGSNILKNREESECQTHMKIKLPGILCVKNQYAGEVPIFCAQLEGGHERPEMGPAL